MKVKRTLMLAWSILLLVCLRGYSLVQVGGTDISSFTYSWTTTDGSGPYFTVDADHDDTLAYYNEGSRAYLTLTGTDVGAVIWHFQCPSGQTFANDVVVTGGCTHLNSGTGSYWEGLWSTDGETWTQFYYREGNWYNDELMTFAMSDYGYAGGERNLYIKWEGQRVAGDWVSGQLFRGRLFEVSGSLDGSGSWTEPLDPAETEEIVNVGGEEEFIYQWNTEDGAYPYLWTNASYTDDISFWNEESGPAYVCLNAANSVESVTWHFWCPEGQTFASDVAVSGSCTHLNSGAGSYWEGVWSTDGETWTQFYYHSENWFSDSSIAVNLSDYGYTGGGRHLYIRWEGLRTEGNWASAQLFRGGLFEVRGSLAGTPEDAPVITLDEEGRWLRNGEVFAPLVLYLPQDIPAISEAGFNTVMAMGAGDPDNLDDYIETLDNAYVHGLGVWVHVCEYFRSSTDYDGLSAVVNALKSHPAVEAWYLADEPSNESISPTVLAAAADIIHGLDANHPVIGLDNKTYNFDDYAPVFDGFLSDPYPIPNSNIDLVTDWINLSRNVINDGESLMVCLQAHGEYWYPRGPTANEIWNMAYQAVVGGVQGIGWWADGPARESGNWSEYQTMLPVLTELMSYTVSGDTRTAYSGSEIYAAVFDGNAGKVLVAVNTSSSSRSLTVSVTASEAEALGSVRNATITIGSSSIELTMDGLGCGAWLLDASVIDGDANGDGAVDVGDLGILAANYGTTSGATWADGDFNGDGAVDVGDLGILAANYGTGTSGADFDADYAKVFGETVEEDADDSDSSLCSALGLPLIAGLALMGFMLVKLEE